MVSGIGPPGYWYPPPMYYPPPAYYPPNYNGQGVSNANDPMGQTPGVSQPPVANYATDPNTGTVPPSGSWYPPPFMWYYAPPWMYPPQGYPPPSVSGGQPPPPGEQTPVNPQAQSSPPQPGEQTPVNPQAQSSPPQPGEQTPVNPQAQSSPPPPGEQTPVNPQAQSSPPPPGEQTPVNPQAQSSPPPPGEQTPVNPQAQSSPPPPGEQTPVNPQAQSSPPPPPTTVSIGPNIILPNPAAQPVKTPAPYSILNGFNIQSNNLANVDYRPVGGNPYVEFSNTAGRFTTTIDHLFYAVDKFGSDFNLTQGIGFNGKPQNPLAQLYDRVLSKFGDSPFSNKARVDVDEALLAQPVFVPDGGAYGMGKTSNPFENGLLSGFSNVGDINQNILYPQRAQKGTMSRNIMFGTDSMDLLDGSGGSDIIRPGAGNDVVNVHTGDYILEENVSSGNDIFFLTIDKNAPSYASTRIFGGNGNDALIVKLSDVEPGDLFTSQDELGNLYTSFAVGEQQYFFYDMEHILFADANGDVAFTLDV